MKFKKLIFVSVIDAAVALIVAFELTFGPYKLSPIIDTQYKLLKFIASGFSGLLKQWAFLTVILTCSLLIAGFIFYFIWKTFFLSKRKVSFRNDGKFRIIFICILCLIIFIYSSVKINYYFLPPPYSFLNIVGNFGILIFVVFLGWGLIRRIKKIILVGSGCIFVFFIFLLAYINLHAYRGIEQSLEKEIKSLSYVNWTTMVNEKPSGVTKYDNFRAFKGVNLCIFPEKSAAFLDMRGNILHSISSDWSLEPEWLWVLIKPYSSNRMLILTTPSELFGKAAILMTDWNANIKWMTKNYFHHDMDVADNGDIYTLTYRRIYSPRISLTRLVGDIFLLILSKDGKIKKELSFVKMMLNSKDLFDVGQIRAMEGYDIWGRFTEEQDGYNTKSSVIVNSLKVVERDIFNKNKILFKKGNVLACIKNLNLIVMIDIDQEKIIWGWGSHDLELPHNPTLLENGNILIFDNGESREYSRVIELNPITKEIEWEYKSDPPELFFSDIMGSAQRLPNGNTLITESQKGRAFEVTKEGEMVWEFYNTEVNEEKNERAIIYRLMRIVDLDKYPVLRELVDL